MTTYNVDVKHGNEWYTWAVLPTEDDAYAVAAEQHELGQETRVTTLS